jgi:hypothetical protein
MAYGQPLFLSPGKIRQILPFPAYYESGSYFSTNRIVCPSGSLTKNPFLNPKFCTGIETTFGEINCDRLSCNRCAIDSASLTTKVVCQCSKSFGFASAGSDRPSFGSRYSKNSIPGPRHAHRFYSSNRRLNLRLSQN